MKGARKVLFLAQQKNCSLDKFYQIPWKISRFYPDTSPGISPNVNTFKFLQATTAVLGWLKNAEAALHRCSYEKVV